MENAPQIHAAIDTEIPLPPGAAEVIAQARENALRGIPGEITFQVEVRKADGRIEKHTLVGTVDGTA